MFNSHLFKIIAAFCGMIILGLISLVVIDTYKSKEIAKKNQIMSEAQASNTKTQTEQVKPLNTTQKSKVKTTH
jgi:hypothetical protein